MPLCATCSHEDRDAIDRALVGGSSVRDVGGRVGISKSAIDRHKSSHVSETLLRAHESHEDARAQTLWAQIVEGLVSTASRLLSRAEQAGNDRVRFPLCANAEKPCDS